jgi:Spy/CpxP family protein refolding chaperone
MTAKRPKWRVSWPVLLLGLWLLTGRAGWTADTAPTPRADAAHRRLVRFMPLFREPRIQKELELTDEQIAEINQLHKQQLSRQSRLMLGLVGLEGDARKEKQAEIQARVEDLRQESAEAMLKVLKPQQVVRFRQLLLQATQTNIFKEPDVAAILKITEEQKQRMARAESLYEAEAQQLLLDARDKRIRPSEYHAKMGELNSQYEQNLEAILTAEQKALLDEMRGKKFDFGNMLAGSLRFGG